MSGDLDQRIREDFEQGQYTRQEMTSPADAFKAGYLAALPRWIPVSERLPDAYERVLTVDNHGRVYMCDYRRNNFKLVFHCDDHDPVTHWMPLPDAPKPPERES